MTILPESSVPDNAGAATPPGAAAAPTPTSMTVTGEQPASANGNGGYASRDDLRNGYGAWNERTGPCPICGQVGSCLLRKDGLRTACRLAEDYLAERVTGPDGRGWTVYPEGLPRFGGRVVAEIERYIRAVRPAGVFEIRVLDIPNAHGKPYLASGYFTDPAAGARAALAYELKHPSGVFLLPNEPDPSTLGRTPPNKMVDNPPVTTSDGDITRRLWLPIDCDPKRAKGVCGTAAHLAASRKLGEYVRDWLCGEMGWPEPLVGFSGNGDYNFFPLDLPNTDEVKAILAEVLKAIRHKGDSCWAPEDKARANVDLSTFSAAQPMRLLGTFNRKGYPNLDQPYRRSRLLSVPAPAVPLTLDMLEAVARLAPRDGKGKGKGRPGSAQPAAGKGQGAPPEKNGQAAGDSTTRQPEQPPQSQSSGAAALAPDRRGAVNHVLDVPRWLTDRKVEFVDRGYTADGRRLFTLAKCPFNDSHTGRDPAIMQQEGGEEDGKPSFNCFHDSCAEKHWEDVRDAIGRPDPDHYNPPLGASPPRLGGGGGGGQLAGAAPGQAAPAPCGRWSNYETLKSEPDEEGNGGGTTYLGYGAATIAAHLFAETGGWPKRVGPLLFCEGPGHKPRYIQTPAELFAAAARLIPQPQSGWNSIGWRTGPEMVTKAEIDAYLRQHAEDFDAVEPFPHYPPLARTYYMHEPLQGGCGSALRTLVNFFSPAKDEDRDLIEAAFMTPGAGLAPGQRPAFLVTAADDDGQGGRGVGKSALVRLVARLWGGAVSVRPEDDVARVVTRLLSTDALDTRVAVLDNLKTLKLSNADLEGLITEATISGHRMYQGEGRRPNTLTWFITLNGCSLSKDMAQRCIPIVLARPTHGGGWEERVTDFIDRHRWEVIGDVVARLKAPAAPLATHSRWAAWEDLVLARVSIDPAAAQKAVSKRQGDIDDDSDEADLVRSFIMNELLHRDPPHAADRETVFIPTQAAAAWVNDALGLALPVNKASSHLRNLGIAELRKSDRGKARGWVWTGRHAPPGNAVHLHKPDPLRADIDLNEFHARRRRYGR